MKTTVIVLFAFFYFHSLNCHAQSGANTSKTSTATSIGIIIYSNDVETVWNAMRLANFSKSEGDTVSIFLLGKGVELENLVKSNNDIKEQTDAFLDGGGHILGCGTCLASRKNNEPQVCKFSSMADLYDLVKKNKKVLTF